MGAVARAIDTLSLGIIIVGLVSIPLLFVAAAIWGTPGPPNSEPDSETIRWDDMPHRLIASAVALVVIAAVIRLCVGFIDGLLGREQPRKHR